MAGMGIGAAVALVEIVVVVVENVWLAVSSFRSDCDLNEYITAAPAPALAAKIASDLDILRTEILE